MTFWRCPHWQYPAGLHYVQRVAELEAQSDELKQQGAQVRTNVDMFITCFFLFFFIFIRFFKIPSGSNGINGISPFLIGNTSSIRVHFLLLLVLREGTS